MIAASNAATIVTAMATLACAEEVTDALGLDAAVPLVLTLSVTAAVALLTAEPSQVTLALADWL